RRDVDHDCLWWRRSIHRRHAADTGYLDAHGLAGTHGCAEPAGPIAGVEDAGRLGRRQTASGARVVGLLPKGGVEVGDDVDRTGSVIDIDRTTRHRHEQPIRYRLPDREVDVRAWWARLPGGPDHEVARRAGVRDGKVEHHATGEAAVNRHRDGGAGTQRTIGAAGADPGIQHTIGRHRVQVLAIRGGARARLDPALRIDNHVGRPGGVDDVDSAVRTEENLDQLGDGLVRSPVEVGGK